MKWIALSKYGDGSLCLYYTSCLFTFVVYIVGEIIAKHRAKLSEQKRMRSDKSVFELEFINGVILDVYLSASLFLDFGNSYHICF